MIKLKKLYNLSNPTNFKNFSLKILPICLIIFIVSFSFGIYFSFFDSPPDYQQGDAVRIMYVHVPSAWIALSGYLFMGISSLIFIIWRHPLASIIAKAQEIIVNEGIITSSPGFKLSALRATISAAVPLVTETAYFISQYLAHFFSNDSRYDPEDEIHSVFIQSKT